MNAQIWLESAPAHVQEEINQLVREKIAGGILQHTSVNLRQQVLFTVQQKSPALDVLEFMTAMNQPPNSLADYARTPNADKNLATQLMFGTGDGAKKGEIYEMRDAWDDFTVSGSLEHLTEFVDGAIDSIYVILWTLNKLGVPADACWKLVQDSNMAKLGPDGKPIKNPETGKIMKPEGWKPPDLFGLLAAAAAQETYIGGVARHD